MVVAVARELPLWHCGLHGERRRQREEAGCLGLVLVVAKERVKRSGAKESEFNNRIFSAELRMENRWYGVNSLADWSLGQTRKTPSIARGR